MIAYGEIRNGKVEIDSAYSIPEGALVKVVVLPAQDGNGHGMHELFARFDELIKNVPEEEWAKLPVDGGLNHDHYLYGAPKR